MSITTELIEVAPINTESAREYNDQALVLSKQATSLVIKTQEHYEGAAGLLRNIKSMAAAIEAARKKITKPLDDAKSAVMDLFRPTSTALDNSERHIKSIMISYSQEQERLRAEQEEKLRREAEAKEAKLRAEKERQEAEWRAKEAAAAAELARQNALIAKAKNEKQRAEAEAAAARARAEQEKAARLAEERRQQAAEVHVEAPVLASTVQKPEGVSMKKNWKARIIDPMKVPREFLCVDEKKLDQIAKATKGSLTISGVQFYSEDVLASR